MARGPQVLSSKEHNHGILSQERTIIRARSNNGIGPKVGKTEAKLLTQIQKQIDDIKSKETMDEVDMQTLLKLTENRYRVEMKAYENNTLKLTDQLDSMNKQLQSYHNDVTVHKRKFKEGNYKLHRKKKRHEQKGTESEIKSILETKVWPMGLIVDDNKIFQIGPDSPGTIVMNALNIKDDNMIRARWWKSVHPVVKGTWKKRRNNVSQKIKDVCIQGK